jgi:hypothetical protein
MQRLGAIEYQQGWLSCVQAPFSQFLKQFGANHGILGRSLSQAEDPLLTVFADPYRHDHRLTGILYTIDHQHRKSLTIEATFGKGPHLGA